jgi:hypothetical protein
MAEGRGCKKPAVWRWYSGVWIITNMAETREIGRLGGGYLAAWIGRVGVALYGAGLGLGVVAWEDGLPGLVWFDIGGEGAMGDIGGCRVYCARLGVNRVEGLTGTTRDQSDMVLRIFLGRVKPLRLC